MSNSQLRSYFDRLRVAPPRHDPRHGEGISALTDWLCQRLANKQPTSIIVICTGNSRRSVFGSMLGNALADGLDLDGLQCFSGGTEPTCVNPRTIRALEEIGIDFSLTGEFAPSGASGEPNPIYTARWSGSRSPLHEFSKHFADPANPQSEFAALLVCDEADHSCPTVAGAALRVSLPFADPKSRDGGPDEVQAYRQCRDQIAGALLEILSKARLAARHTA